MSEIDSKALRHAAENNVVALAIDRVGEGGSKGPRDHYGNWLNLDAGKDVRNGWMYHYVMSALRAVTLLHTLDEVRAERIGVSGFSRGGVCSLLVSAVDDRIALCVPISATGDFATTVEFEDNWILPHIIEGAGKTKESAAWRRFVESYDPLNYIEQSQALLWIVNGAQDEYFPITSSRALMTAGAASKRIEVIFDADHGYYGSDTGFYDMYLNTGLWRRRRGCLMKAIRAVLHGQGVLPETPHTVFDLASDQLRCVARIDTRDPVAAVQLIFSADRAYTFRRVPMRPRLGGASAETGEWEASVPFEGDSLAAFVEVTYSDAVGPYYLTSVPHLSEGFVPKIRPAYEP